MVHQCRRCRLLAGWRVELESALLTGRSGSLCAIPAEYNQVALTADVAHHYVAKWATVTISAASTSGFEL